MQIRRLIQGTTPLLISMPHMGTFLPPDLKHRMTDAARKLPDTDWHLDRLYWFAVEMGASVLMPTHSRYVVDLNRPPDDASLYPGQLKTGLCPLETFSGEKIYREGEEPDEIEKLNRLAAYWLPYHETLAAELLRLKQEYGYAILYDAHSIKSEVPRLFEGRLPDLNLGSANGASCALKMAESALEAASSGDYSAVLNGRFVGGYITRHYGKPQQHIHALQMELAEINYMDENLPHHYDENRAEKLQKVLKNVLRALLAWGQQNYRG
ncbi:MAG: N-formylglutamate deformylase [Alphaproteobacteria bacterium]|nr:N-formylglutamate deformylase [Alphaproteobacteria bacterium]